MTEYREKAIKFYPVKCLVCDDEVPQVLIHHVDGDDTNHDIQNLMPVCKMCHQRIHVEKVTANTETWLYANRAGENKNFRLNGRTQREDVVKVFHNHGFTHTDKSDFVEKAVVEKIKRGGWDTSRPDLPHEKEFKSVLGEPEQ